MMLGSFNSNERLNERICCFRAAFQENHPINLHINFTVEPIKSDPQLHNCYKKNIPNNGGRGLTVPRKHRALAPPLFGIFFL